MYAPFPPAIPRMPSWWPVTMTWGRGLPSSVPIGYMAYFGVPALVGAALGNKAGAAFGWRRPIALLTVGLGVGFVWALLFNGLLGARLGAFRRPRVLRFESPPAREPNRQWRSNPLVRGDSLRGGRTSAVRCRNRRRRGQRTGGKFPAA